VAGLKNPTRTTRDRSAGLVRPGLTTIQLPVVEFDVRPVYDFLMSACNDCGELEDLLPEDRGWLQEGRAAVLAEVGGTESARACIGFGGEIGRLLVVRPEVKTARQVVAAVDELSDAELLECLFGELIDSPEVSDFARRALNGDGEAYAALGDQLKHWKGHAVMPETLAELAPGTRRALHGWLPRFERVEDRVGRMLTRDVAGRHADDAVANPLGFVEKATNGIRMVPDQRTRRIVLAPSYFGRPYNSLTKVGEITLVCYPIADSALGAGGRSTPPVATVRLYRALGDESRLRILRLLAERDLYLTELATALDLSKPTVSHHLAQLRSAGLVTMTEQGNLTYYTLRRDRAAEAGPELSAFLAR
jgi:DNA-binding transcriptional ArsR family regulator